MSQSRVDEFRDFILDTDEARETYAERRLALEIANGIAQRRRRLGLRQSDLEEATGIRQSEISSLEAGRLTRGPTSRTLIRLAKALGINIAVEYAADGSVSVNIRERAAPAAGITVDAEEVTFEIYNADHPAEELQHQPESIVTTDPLGLDFEISEVGLDSIQIDESLLPSNSNEGTQEAEGESVSIPVSTQWKP